LSGLRAVKSLALFLFHFSTLSFSWKHAQSYRSNWGMTRAIVHGTKRAADRGKACFEIKTILHT
jgi:hypothetical protein